MQFTQRQIEQAKSFKEMGLAWEPRAGHFVYDETDFCRRASPFQKRVFFILNYDFFIERVGGLQRFKEIMTWLPTWDDSRQILRELGVGNDELAVRLAAERSVECDDELSTLYDMIEDELVRNHPDAPVAEILAHA
jgi:hypothetical protein